MEVPRRGPAGPAGVSPAWSGQTSAQRVTVAHQWLPRVGTGPSRSPSVAGRSCCSPVPGPTPRVRASGGGTGCPGSQSSSTRARLVTRPGCAKALNPKGRVLPAAEGSAQREVAVTFSVLLSRSLKQQKITPSWPWGPEVRNQGVARPGSPQPPRPGGSVWGEAPGPLFRLGGRLSWAGGGIWAVSASTVTRPSLCVCVKSPSPFCWDTCPWI